MTKEEPKKPVRKKRKPGRPRVETVYYVLEIADWEWSFMFGANVAIDRDGPYSDYRHLQLRGTMLRPAKIKAETVELVFLPDRRLNEGERERDRPIGIGSLNLHRGHLQGIFPMPSDVLPLLLTMLTADKLRYVVMSGEKMRYGNARIQNFRMEMSIDEDDLPAED
ncbi:hypothetical protein [Brucella pseudintermedia]|uniref:hypothetical protein n=1 Tax=Brucella pseudintermedia TaxID=370111 RepID=UPI00320A7EDB